MHYPSRSEWHVPSFFLLSPPILVLILSAVYRDFLGIIGLAIVWSLVLISLALFTLRIRWLILTSLSLVFAFIQLYHPVSKHLSLSISHDLTEELVLLCVAATALALLIQQIRLKSIRLQQKEQQTSVLYGLARKLASTNSLEEGIQLFFETLSLQGFCATALYLKKGESPSLVRHPLSQYSPSFEEQQETELILSQTDDTRRVRRNSQQHLICSLFGFKERLGYLIVREQAPHTLKDENTPFFEALIDQFATAFEREIFREKAQDIALMSKTQTLYKNLLNSVSHELKTPLVSITGSASALLDPVIQANSGRCHALASEILTASQRLTEVLDKLLDMSRIDSGTLKPKLESVDARDLIALTCQRISFETNDPIFSICCDTLNPSMNVDPVLISQALYYIIQNGLRYGPARGPLSIFVEEHDSDLLISVRDHGPGIPVALQEKIFDKFYRGKPEKTGGLGLGLSIAHGFLEVHGGRITVKNHPEGGAIFTLFIPKGGPH